MNVPLHRRDSLARRMRCSARLPAVAPTAHPPPTAAATRLQDPIHSFSPHRFSTTPSLTHPLPTPNRPPVVVGGVAGRRCRPEGRLPVDARPRRVDRIRGGARREGHGQGGPRGGGAASSRRRRRRRCRRRRHAGRPAVGRAPANVEGRQQRGKAPPARARRGNRRRGHAAPAMGCVRGGRRGRCSVSRRGRWKAGSPPRAHGRDKERGPWPRATVGVGACCLHAHLEEPCCCGGRAGVARPHPTGVRLLPPPAAGAVGGVGRSRIASSRTGVRAAARVRPQGASLGWRTWSSLQAIPRSHGGATQRQAVSGAITCFLDRPTMRTAD